MANGGFLGIDLTGSSLRPTAYVAIDDTRRIIYSGFAGEDNDLIQKIESEKPDIIAIDAPLALPLGWHCLEPECGCRSNSIVKGRVCERELSLRGIPSYYVTTKCIIKSLVYRGIALRESLEKMGFKVIEVYPYATKVRLWGKGIPRKTTAEGIRFLRSRLAELIPDSGTLEPKPDHDLCDAFIAAYTAHLHAKGETEPVGIPEEGLLWIPRGSVKQG